MTLIWETVGQPVRAGMGIWKPYEHMDWPTQETMLHAAAVALQLAADGRITACGVLGAAIQPTTPFGCTTMTGPRHSVPLGWTPPRGGSRARSGPHRFGVFVRIEDREDGFQGLVHTSRLDELPGDIVEVDDALTVKIIEFDLTRRRIALSQRQADQ